MTIYWWGCLVAALVMLICIIVDAAKDYKKTGYVDVRWLDIVGFVISVLLSWSTVIISGLLLAYLRWEPEWLEEVLWSKERKTDET